MEEELTELLSCLWTDANMALRDEWDRSDSGFKAQIILIEYFTEKHNIILKNTTEI